MKNKKDISDLIRDNQHKLEERPSAKVWDKLESKLDNHENKSRSFLYRRLALAAAVVALVAVVSLLTVVNQDSNKNMEMAYNEAPSSTWVAQDLETIETDTDQNVQKVIEFQRVLKERYANPIKEGRGTKKLLASNKQLTNTPTPIANEPRELIAMADEVQDNQATIVLEENNNTSTSATTAHTESEVFEDAGIIAASDSDISAASDDAFASAKKDKLEMKEKAQAARVQAKKRKADSFSSAKKKSTSSIQNYKWLAGSWEANGEKLELQFLNQADIISDDFQIKQLGNELFFTLNKPTKSTYAFVEKNNTLTIFENYKNEKIVLEKIDAFSFSITFLSKDGKEDKVITYKKW